MNCRVYYRYFSLVLFSQSDVKDVRIVRRIFRASSFVTLSIIFTLPKRLIHQNAKQIEVLI